jgi:hypothetical protein
MGFNIVFLFFCALGLNFEAVNFIKKYAEAFGSILGVWDRDKPTKIELQTLWGEHVRRDLQVEISFS